LTNISFLDGSDKLLLIGGKWVRSRGGERFPTLNPATGGTLAHVQQGSPHDIDDAVASARSAFEGEWRRYTPYDRQELLLKVAELVDRHYEELAWLDTSDMGAPITRLRNGKRRVIGLLRYYAGMATALHGDTLPNSAPGSIFSYTLAEPVGVVGAILPWNGPFGMAVWKLGPVLATGCTAVLKPSEESPLSALRLGELLIEAGVPDGVVNIVTGGGDCGAALAAHPGVDKVCFTGSTETGRRIVEASAGNLKRLSLELGGKSPNIVFPDADLDAAAAGAATAIFSNTGQICSAGSRLLVHESIYDNFVERVAVHAGRLRVGNGADPDSVIGPVVSEKQFNRVNRYLDIGRSEGAEVACGGMPLRAGNLANGWFIAPTVFRNVEDQMTIAREEIFGPVLSALSFRETDEVIRRANDTPFGLGAGIWTNDVNKAHYVSGRLRVGSVWVNCYQVMDPGVPFGGYKASGYGRESGRQHLEEFLNTKAVWLRVGEPA
jgi:aldehyde dehydrogenase (NAD+)